ncbi:disease resistance protein RGA2-like [Eucalyptus grandis]|uniref:disease resistance protein RGA2-like n=1 Tax=Eucalyptus grandis TaxID=71139 RepID=UPI00192EB2BA|nr:disease resistance protein RGA2-like [Eucalyptus grandis]
MAEAVISIGGSVLANLITQALGKVGNLWGIKRELQVLESTVTMLQALLDNAEEQQHQSSQIKDWVEKLKEVFYDLQDVLEEFNIEAMRGELKGDNQMIKVNVSILPIVGIGGLGKTALAKFVYNDEMISRHFDLKMWVCVSDDFDMKKIVKDIIVCVEKKEPNYSSMDGLQSELRKIIDGSKYLLVLDDLWDAKSETWPNLKSLLMGGTRGSKILITTRLPLVAEITSPAPPLLLEGLFESDSLDLLMRMAGRKEGGIQDLDMLAIGKEIVRNCFGVPLVVRTIGRFGDKEAYSSLSLDGRRIYPAIKFRKQGELSIENLGSVTNAEVKCEDEILVGKHSLESLILSWGDFLTDDVVIDEVLIDGLKPPSNLQRLKILKYKGESFPKSMMDSLVVSSADFPLARYATSIKPRGSLYLEW